MEAAEYINNHLEEVPGWFSPWDGWIFAAIDALQTEHGVSGDILEIGAYVGRSTALLGCLRRDEEKLVVCDLFDQADAPDAHNQQEQVDWYENIALEAFRTNFARVHDWLPELLVGPSSAQLERVPDGSVRFAHVDGSHSYDAVRSDIAAMKRITAPGGIIAFDDVVGHPNPGVAAAVWEAVANDGLEPLALTRKLYATWGSPITAGMITSSVDAGYVKYLGTQSLHGREVPEFGPDERYAEPRPSVGWYLTPPIVSAAARRTRSLWQKRRDSSRR